MESVGTRGQGKIKQHSEQPQGLNQSRMGQPGGRPGAELLQGASWAHGAGRTSVWQDPGCVGSYVFTLSECSAIKELSNGIGFVLTPYFVPETDI